jgi:hypothetical protein
MDELDSAAKALAAAGLPQPKQPEPIIVNGQVVDGAEIKAALTGGGGISRLIAEGVAEPRPDGSAYVPMPPMRAGDTQDLEELAKLNGPPPPGSYVGPPQPLRSIYRGIHFQTEEEAEAWVAFMTAGMPRADSLELADKNADVALASYKMRRGELDRAARARKAG